MLTSRIIACLDVKDGRVVKGVKFKGHVDLGGIVELAQRYRNQGIDELVFYDITASAEKRAVDPAWVSEVSRNIDIPFCVAGGIRDVATAEKVLYAGADKISINTPALEDPKLITRLAERFGSQCVVVGVDSKWCEDDYYTWKYTGSEKTIAAAGKRTFDWVNEAQLLGAGEIVLNCMDSDGTRKGFDIEQLQLARKNCQVPLIASGGAGGVEDFYAAFTKAKVDGALAAGIFHRGEVKVTDLKLGLIDKGVCIRPPALGGER